MSRLATIAPSEEIRAILDAAPFPLLISRLSDGTVLYANDRLAAMVDLTARDIVGSKTPDFYADPRDRETLLAKLAREGRVTDYELRLRDRAGRDRWALASVAIAELRSEKVVVAGLTEITERKETERALLNSERKFRSLVENANDLIYMLTPDGTFTYASPNWPEVLGQEVSEVVDQSFAPLIHPEDLEACWAFLASVVETGQKRGGIEYRVRHKDGSWRWHTSNASCLKDGAGRVEAFLGIARDITEKKEAQRALEQAHRSLRETQAQLVQAEKMAALSNLVAGITHEFNSPLGAIHSVQGTLATAVTRLEQELESSKPGDEPENREIQSMLKAIWVADDVIGTGVERVTEIVRRLRSFVRLDEAELKKANLHEGIESTLALLHSELEGRLDVVRDYGDVPAIICYPAKLNQVFLNILTNASHAIEGKGTIAIKTSIEGDMVCASFRDSGTGISEEDLKSIFDLGFSTKGKRVGAGLGLAICRQIVQQHRGTLSVDSRFGEGSVFTVRIPLTQEGAT